MKKLITLIGIVSALSLIPGCRKDSVQPIKPVNSNAPAIHSSDPMIAARITSGDTASLYVLIDSEPCGTVQSQYTSASVDIRDIEVFNTQYGWEHLTPVPGAWDVISIESAPVPIAEITEVSQVHAGEISKIRLTIGENNQLVVNNEAASCYKIQGNKIVINLDETITADALNEIVLNIDICGKFKTEVQEDSSICYLLKPEFSFQSITVR
jgi:hypothetical protein